MEIITGDETGLLKSTKIGTSQSLPLLNSVNNQSRALYSVDRLAVSPSSSSELVVLTKSSTLRVFGPGDSPVVDLAHDVCAGQRCKELVFADFERLCCVGDKGRVEMRSWPDGAVVGSFDVPGPVEGAALDVERGRLAVGGKGMDVSVWDVETGKMTYRGKNVPNDKLDMQVSVWITDLAWAQGEGAENLLATSTAYNRVRINDVRVKQPIRDMSLEQKGTGGNEPNKHINCILAVPDGNFVTADTYGNVCVVDAMNAKRVVAKFKGAKGSIRALAYDPSSKMLATGGLDRVVRVYEYESRRLIGRSYVKQRLTDLAFRKLNGAGGGGEGEDGEEDEDDWESLEGELRDEDEEKDDEEEEGREEEGEELPEPVKTKSQKFKQFPNKRTKRN